jgi:DNA-binding response OmpR family regulator
MPKILVVDDEPNMLEMYRVLLTRRGHTIVAAPNGARALDALQQEAVDVVITDLRMPNIDGHELIRRIKTSFPKTPVIVITAETTVKDAVGAVGLGAFDCLFKPFNVAEMIDSISRCMACSGAATARYQAYLTGLSSLVSRAAARDELLQFILDAAMRAVHADTAHLYSSMPDGNFVDHAAATGEDDFPEQQRLSERLALYAVRNRQALILDKKLNNIPVCAEYTDVNTASCSIILPLIKHDRTLGALYFARSTGAFVAQDLEQARIYAAHAALMVLAEYQLPEA